MTKYYNKHDRAQDFANNNTIHPRMSVVTS